MEILDPAADVRNVFLSPHFDDIALSCGGTVAAIRNAGRRAEILVIFGAEAPLELSGFARAMIDDWGMEPGGATTARTAEEAEAARRMGARVTVLDFADAIYRGDRYLADDQLMGQVHPDELGLAEEICSAVIAVTADGRDGDAGGNERATRWFAPAAIGDHVDHQHIYGVGRLLARAGADVWFYEDLPYALRPERMTSRAGTLRADGLEPLGRCDVTATWTDKIAAVAAYPSQLQPTFGWAVDGPVTIAAVEQLLRRTASDEVGGPAGELVERSWRRVGRSGQ